MRLAGSHDIAGTNNGQSINLTVYNKEQKPLRLKVKGKG